MYYTAQKLKLSTFNSPLPTSRGFTLIELLVVIAIIFTITGVIFVKLLDVRARSRDAKRKGDLATIQSAIQQARADIGSYPIDLVDGISPAIPTDCVSPFIWEGVNAGTADDVEYLKLVPCDPSDSSAYKYISDGKTYELFACLENVKDPQRDANDGAAGDLCGPVPPPTVTDGFVSYTVRNPR